MEWVLVEFCKTIYDISKDNVDIGSSGARLYNQGYSGGLFWYFCELCHPYTYGFRVARDSQIALFSIMDWGEGVGMVFSVLYRLAEFGIVFVGVLVLVVSAMAITGNVVEKMGNNNQ